MKVATIFQAIVHSLYEAAVAMFFVLSLGIPFHLMLGLLKVTRSGEGAALPMAIVMWLSYRKRSEATFPNRWFHKIYGVAATKHYWRLMADRAAGKCTTFSLAAGFAATALAFYAILTRDTVKSIVATFLFGITLFLHHVFEWWDQAKRQEERHQKYAKWLLRPERDLEHSFSLYLRPFSTAGRLLCANPQYQPFLGSHRFYYERPWLEFEEWLASTLVVDAPLVGLGAPEARPGAAILPSNDDNWFAIISAAINSATRVLVVPLTGSGTSKEIELLLTGRLRMRALFLMPPSEKPRWPIPMNPLPRQAIPLKEAWAQSQEFWRERNLNLPNYDPKGMIFFFAFDGSVAESAEVNLAEPTSFIETVLQMGARQIGHLFEDNARKADQQKAT